MDAYLASKAERESEWQALELSYTKAANSLKYKWEKLERDHGDLQAKKEALVEQNGGSDVMDSDILDINAGGQVVRVSRGTLTQKKGSRLESIFSGRWEKQLHRDSKGRIFLDVNSECFKCIVDYLNEFKIAPPDSPPEMPKADPENQVVLDALLTAFGLLDAWHVDSEILTDATHIDALTGFLADDELGQGLELLYRGSRDGMDASSFHRLCDNQGSTITVVKSSGNYIFGGFSGAAWTSMTPPSYYASTKAFVFGLHCHGGTAPVKMHNISPVHAIYQHPSCGPTFGVGHDLSLIPGGRTCSNLGHSYSLPTGIYRHYFTGNQEFSMSEIEVFKVVTTAKAQTLPSRDQQPLCLTTFPEALQKSFQTEETALLKASTELAALQEAFSKEQSAIEVFCQGNHEDIVHLNVSGHTMALKPATLAKYPDSVLYKHFADPNWNGKRKVAKSPREWDANEVVAWSKEIDGLSEDVSDQFEDVTGKELLVLKRDDIKDLGVRRPGTIALVVDAIKKLQDEQEESASTFIEQSEYCFGKIVDHMRLKSMSELGVPDPKPPVIREPDRKRFKRIIAYYFPTTESAADFLGE